MGRAWAAALRGTALILAWLILLNPSWPVALRSAPDSEIALLDASYSMSRPSSPGGSSLWSLARDSAARFERLWLFGGSVPRAVPADSIPGEPLYADSRLVPAMRAAALAGAQHLVVFTDGAIADVSAAAEEARRLGLDVTPISLRTDYPQIGIAEVRSTRWVQDGDTAEVVVDVVAKSAETDSIRIEVVDDGGRVRARGWASTPGPDRFTSARLAFPVSRTRDGYARFVVRLSTGLADPEQRDNERSFYVRVTESPVGPVLVSLRPDWEPSFLIPNLDRLSDAPATAYLWISDSLVTLDGYRKVSLASVQRNARAAPLLVLHGYGADAPPWARQLARDARRLLVMPEGTSAFELPGWSVRVRAATQGEWYVSADLPASPLSLELAGFPVEELSPLLRVRTVDAGDSWSALTVQRLRRGEPVSALLAGTAGARRWALATGEGYWRWAFRRGAGRALYVGLWTGLGGWLMEGRSRGEMRLEPRERVVERDQPFRWSVPVGTDSLAVELRSAEDELVLRAVAAMDDSLATRLPPGRYQYAARAYRSGRVVASASGPVEVEQFSRELLPGSDAAVEGLLELAAVQRSRDRDSRQHRLATLGWPYLLLIALFCAEWVLRRFIGLR